ncbi:putative pre-mRNA-splicing factor ATP-dependent RNA helicase dhx16 [Coelomomyces lativittatus]|nr:putative pre-mRNA-splicing factor ATP-dependent RNA helicase dhx16 [Coelomomyces lativittatus]
MSYQHAVNRNAEKAQHDKDKATKELLQKNTSYELVKETYDEKNSPLSSTSISRQKHSSKRHLRIKRESEEKTKDSDHRTKIFKRSHEEIKDIDPEAETARLRDLDERDAFAKRLKERDQERRQKLIEDKTRTTEAAQQRQKLAEDTTSREEALPSIRERSRQEYLKKREAQQLALLKAQYEAEVFLFKDEKLTDRERAELNKKGELIRLAEEKKKLDILPQTYSLPESYLSEKDKLNKKKLDAALYGRYEVTDEVIVNEQEQWESHQIQHAGLAAPSSSSRKNEENEYDYLFDEDQQIDFVLNQTLPPSLDFDFESLNETIVKTKAESIKEMRESLPIFPYRKQLLDALEEFQVLIIVGETGSGKTTQMTQYLHEAGYTKDKKKIGCTQPRRVAAMSVAARVAQEMRVKLGNEVGYSIRFEDCTNEKTIIKYMTDGMLLREFLNEPDLASYSVMIIDEAHERTLHTDILFALVKDIARFRSDLKILISSATMDAQKFSEYFDDAPIFYIPGRKYPVDIYYTKAPEANYLGACVATVMQIHITQPPGDILVFLTGQEEIEATQEALNAISRSLGSKIKELIIAPIYAALPSDLQNKIFEPTPEDARKVVLATNIAETSITIDGIVHVIDPGFCKQNSYNPRTGMSSLIVTPCSRASANQRAGRAGRLGPGKCFRLYTSWAYENELEENTIPEIQRTNLTGPVLLLKSLGIHDLMHFDFMDAPPAETLMRALEQLYALGVLNDRGDLTKLGRRMAEFPLDPMMSRTLVASETFQCSEEMASIVAMLSVQNAIFYRPKDRAMHADKAKQGFHVSTGDHLSLLNVWNQWVDANYSVQFCYDYFIQYRSMQRAHAVRDQIVQLMERVEIPMQTSGDPISILKALVSGFFYHTCRIHANGQSYRNLKHNNTIWIHPTSSLYKKEPRFVIYHELVLTSKEFMRQVSEIETSWLLEVAPHFYQTHELDEKARKKEKMPHPLAKVTTSNTFESMS